MNSLPSEVVVNIFSYLEIEDLCLCRQVCKRWLKIFEEYKLVAKFFPELQQSYDPERKKALVRTIKSNSFASLSPVITKVKKFLAGTELNKKRLAVILNQRYPEQTLKIEAASYDTAENPDFLGWDKTKTWLVWEKQKKVHSLKQKNEMLLFDIDLEKETTFSVEVKEGYLKEDSSHQLKTHLRQIMR